MLSLNIFNIILIFKNIKFEIILPILYIIHATIYNLQENIQLTCWLTTKLLQT